MMRKVYILFMLLLCISGIYAQNKCSEAILLTDSLVLKSPQSIGEKWLWFQPRSKDLILRMITGSSKTLDYFLYKTTDPNFCDSLAKVSIIPLQARVSDMDSGLIARVTLSRLDLEGLCSCSICRLSPQVLHLDTSFKYYLQILTFSDSLVLLMDYNWEDEKGKQSTGKFNEDIKVGETIALNNILFKPESPVMLSTSLKELEGLLIFLNENPKIKIEIQGHTNALKPDNDPKYKTLSEQRAKAVYDYLIKNKIAAKRLSYKGFGNSKLLYLNATDPELQQKNRRVEILILSK